MSEEKIVIAIAREFGSGGHEVGKILAENLNLDFYDAEILNKVAEKTGYHKEYIRENEEKIPGFSFSNLITGIEAYQASPFDQVQIEEHKYIEELGEKGNCVIVGRGADYILEGNPNAISVFLFAPIEARLKRIKNHQAVYHVSEEDAAASDAALLKQIKSVDKQRRKYYEFYTDNKWGARDEYDLLINTERAGIEGAAKIIETYIKESRGQNISNS